MVPNETLEAMNEVYNIALCEGEKHDIAEMRAVALYIRKNPGAKMKHASRALRQMLLVYEDCAA